MYINEAEIHVPQAGEYFNYNNAISSFYPGFESAAVRFARRIKIKRIFLKARLLRRCLQRNFASTFLVAKYQSAIFRKMKYAFYTSWKIVYVRCNTHFKDTKTLNIIYFLYS